MDNNPTSIDVTALNGMQFDRELFEELISTFEKVAMQSLVAIGDARNKGLVEGVKAQAHRLRGSAAQLGALALRDACAAIEVRATTEQVIDHDTIKLLGDLVQGALIALRQILQEAEEP